MGANHLAILLESYDLATKRPPPPGHILVHSQVEAPPQAYERSGRFRAWWARPGEEFILCACGWRPDLGEHYRVCRPGPVVRHRGRPRIKPAA